MCRICKGIGKLYFYAIYADRGTDCATRPSYLICYHCEGTGKEPWFMNGHKILDK